MNETPATPPKPGDLRNGLFAAGDEGGGLAAQRDQVRLGQHLGQVIGAQRLEEGEERLPAVEDRQEAVGRRAVRRADDVLKRQGAGAVPTRSATGGMVPVMPVPGDGRTKAPPGTDVNSC